MTGIFSIGKKSFIYNAVVTLFIWALFTGKIIAQISPGELCLAHAHLEGMSNCTRCHVLGAKVSNEKCLECHVEIKDRIAIQKGYHSASQITGKECASCHSDHHGRNFRIINLDQESFDHALTGFELLGAHRNEECKNCHKPEFISDKGLRQKKFTFLGLNTDCLLCHADYHQKSLSDRCTDCHGIDSFKPAVNFDHHRTRFPLAGKHKSTDCIKCHKLEVINGQQFQEFAGVSFENCTSCHQDVHLGRFGLNCRECHSEDSFHSVTGMDQFDHSRTNFPLADKHALLTCKSCHKTTYTNPVKHDLCSDCHADYHNAQFKKDGTSPDCSSCHTTRGFSGSSFTLEQHNEGRFGLTGAHMATPCYECHKKDDKWSFREIGMDCADCHKDIHETFIDKRYYPESNCKRCHSVDRWNEVTFDHSLTNFSLTGSHAMLTCRQCHFLKGDGGAVLQQFIGRTTNCSGCHKDVHAGQFELDGIIRCDRCHSTNDWKASNFDHNRTRFILDGKHKDVACNKCHKELQKGQVTYVHYKFNDFKCETCHL